MLINTLRFYFQANCLTNENNDIFLYLSCLTKHNAENWCNLEVAKSLPTTFYYSIHYLCISQIRNNWLSVAKIQNNGINAQVFWLLTAKKSLQKTIPNKNHRQKLFRLFPKALSFQAITITKFFLPLVIGLPRRGNAIIMGR